MQMFVANPLVPGLFDINDQVLTTISTSLALLPTVEEREYAIRIFLAGSLFEGSVANSIISIMRILVEEGVEAAKAAVDMQVVLLDLDV